MPARRDAQRTPPEHVGGLDADAGPAILLAAIHIQRKHIPVAIHREDDPGGDPIPVGAAVADVAHASTPPLFSSAPSTKWGRSELSNMVSAEAIAMCMSRYL